MIEVANHQAKNLSMIRRAATAKEIRDLATGVFGSRRDAAAWLRTPALGLNQARPVDLLVTAAGRRLVYTLLVQLEYGVYP